MKKYKKSMNGWLSFMLVIVFFLVINLSFDIKLWINLKEMIYFFLMQNIVIIKMLLIMMFSLICMAFFTMSERKVMAAMQRRKGPNVVGIFGMLQPLADGFKLLIKELIIPLKSNWRLFIWSPIMVLSLSFICWMIIPFTSETDVNMWKSNPNLLINYKQFVVFMQNELMFIYKQFLSMMLYVFFSILKIYPIDMIFKKMNTFCEINSYMNLEKHILINEMSNNNISFKINLVTNNINIFNFINQANLWFFKFDITGNTIIFYSLLMLLVISSLNVYGIIIAGWSSYSKYAFFGALSSAAQMISYEVSMVLVLLPVILLSGTLNLTEIIWMQMHTNWYIISLFPSFLLFIISMVAETNRAPFDLPEAEAELVAGYNVEYSAIVFAMFFLGEYSNMMMMSILATILFLGGWSFSMFFDSIMISSLMFMIKILIFCYLYMLMRASLPSYRYDQLMDIGWKVFLPWSLCFLWFVLILYLNINLNMYFPTLNIQSQMYTPMLYIYEFMKYQKTFFMGLVLNKEYNILLNFM